MGGYVTCRKLSCGETVVVPADELVVRLSAYGIIVHQGRILLMRLPSGKLFFPGGGVELGESLRRALKREMLEETGHRVRVEAKLTFKEAFLFYEERGIAWHSIGLFFRCSLLTPADLVMANTLDADEGNPEWVPLYVLSSEDFHGEGGPVFMELQDRSLL